MEPMESWVETVFEVEADLDSRSLTVSFNKAEDKANQLTVLVTPEEAREMAAKLLAKAAKAEGL